jgi:choline dehydrogenase-like flavoprotein
VAALTNQPVTAPLTATNLTTNSTYAAEARALYDSEHTGPYASPTGDFLAFLPLVNISDQASAIHAQATSQDPADSIPADAPTAVASGYAAQHSVLAGRLLSHGSAVVEMIWADGVVVLGLEHPFSRGRVRAAAASVFAAAPLADPAYLRNPVDVAVLAEGVRAVRRLAATDAIAGALAPVVEVSPGANVTSDDDLAAFVRAGATTLYHPAGSCKLGARELGGVVDGQLKVYGVEGLRVVDASIMPLLPASHTMTTVYAVAERVSSMSRGENTRSLIACNRQRI